MPGNCTRNVLDVAQKLFGQDGVIAVMYIPHTANIFQMPDLSLLEVLTISKNIKECI
jgi:hypothetical protein